jgi:hypothetical protein
LLRQGKHYAAGDRTSQLKKSRSRTFLTSS